MNHEQGSYRQILKSTSIVGLATGATILFAVARMKILAVLLGPIGVGLFGLFGALVATASAIAGMGISSSGTRHLAAAEGEEAKRRARAALWTAAIPLAVAGALAIWLARAPLAEHVVGAPEEADSVGLLGIAVALTVIGSAQLVELQAFRLIRGLSFAKVLGAGLGTIAVAWCAWAWGIAGLAAAAIAVPLAAFLATEPFRRRLPHWRWRGLSTATLAPEWRSLIGQGAVIMASTIMAQLVQLGVRAVIANRTGLDAAGLYQAAWAISSTNAALVLGAMAADYFPRVSAAARNPGETSAILNQQLHVALLLAAPLTLLTIVVAEPLIRFLYTGDFVAVAQLLRWQVAGDFVKLASWAIGFVLIARKAMVGYFLLEALFSAVYLSGVLLLLPRLALEGVGIAYLLSYLSASASAVAILGFGHGITVSRGNLALGVTVLAVAVALILLFPFYPVAAVGLGALGCLALSIYGAAEISRATGLRRTSQKKD